MLRSRWFVHAAATAALLAFLPSTSDAGANVRPQVSVGTSMPVAWGTSLKGKALGVAVEVERSARWSTVAEFEAHWLETTFDGYDAMPAIYPAFYDQSGWSEATLFTGQFGLRMHLTQSSRVRPYVQAGLGVRVGGGSQGGGAVPVNAFIPPPPASTAPADGPTAHVRLGLTTAGYRGAGLFIDGSAEALLRRPGNFVLAPVRIGITLP